MMQALNRFSFFSGFCFLLIACSGGAHENAATKDLGTREKMYYEQYMVQGRILYKQHCANCHKEEGSGLGRLIPPLAGADYMLNDIPRTACIIKYGMEGEIVVNGVDYNQAMPANNQLTDIEIAQITTYVSNSWNNASGYYSVKDVSAFLDSCDFSLNK